MDTTRCFDYIKNTFHNDKSFRDSCVSAFGNACLINDVDTARAFACLGIFPADILETFISICERKSVDITKWYINEYCSNYESTCFNILCQYGDIETVTWLINEMNVTSYLHSHVAFTKACDFGQYELAEYLLINSAKIFDETGMIPVLLNDKHTKILDLLFQYEVDIKSSVDQALINVCKKYEFVIKSSVDTAFINARRQSGVDHVKKLIECGADVSSMRVHDLFVFECYSQISNLINDDNYVEIFINAVNFCKTTIMDEIYQKYINNTNWHTIFKNCSMKIRSNIDIINWILSVDYKYYIDNTSTCKWIREGVNLTVTQIYLFKVVFDKEKIDLKKVIELDEMSFYVLCSKNKVLELMRLQNIYPHITFRVDENGKVVDYSLNSLPTKSARKI